MLGRFLRTLLLCAFIIHPLALAEADTGEGIDHPALFGTREVFATDIARFYKWTEMLDRWQAQKKAATHICAPGEWVRCEPAEWRQIVDALRPLDLMTKLAVVNELVNHHPYVPSYVNWDNPNYWETPFEFFQKSGQCQDYAIAKFMLLRAAGVSNEEMRLVVLRDARRNLDHAVVVVYAKGEAWLLDNQTGQILPADDVPNYRPYYSINETGWWLHEPNPLNISIASLR